MQICDQRTRFGLISLYCVFAFSVSRILADPPEFQIIDTLPGFAEVEVRGVSANGLVVVGRLVGAHYVQAFRWTRELGTCGLGYLPGGDFSEAHATSYDGSSIVGVASSAGNLASAIRWGADGEITTIHGSAVGMAISADGTSIGGFSYSPTRAFLWRCTNDIIYPATGDQPLGAGLSEDGSTFVGRHGGFHQSAFRWTATTGTLDLGWIGGGDYSSAAAVSCNGAIVVGTVRDAFSFYTAFRWTVGQGMISLGIAPPSYHRSDALAMSADGTVIVGTGDDYARMDRAFIWTHDQGMQDLQQVLGPSVPRAWLLSRATGISADGLTIVGTGYDYYSNGPRRGWVVRLPRPQCWGDLNCDGAFDLLDLPAFVLALTDTIAYSQAYPACGFARADINHDGLRDAIDIQGFVNALLDGECPQ